MEAAAPIVLDQDAARQRLAAACLPQEQHMLLHGIWWNADLWDNILEPPSPDVLNAQGGLPKAFFPVSSLLLFGLFSVFCFVRRGSYQLVKVKGFLLCWLKICGKDHFGSFFCNLQSYLC